MANIFSRPGHDPCGFSRATKGPDSGKRCRSQRFIPRAASMERIVPRRWRVSANVPRVPSALGSLPECPRASAISVGGVSSGNVKTSRRVAGSNGGIGADRIGKTKMPSSSRKEEKERSSETRRSRRAGRSIKTRNGAKDNRITIVGHEATPTGPPDEQLTRLFRDVSRRRWPCYRVTGIFRGGKAGNRRREATKRPRDQETKRPRGGKDGSSDSCPPRRSRLLSR